MVRRGTCEGRHQAACTMAVCLGLPRTPAGLRRQLCPQWPLSSPRVLAPGTALPWGWKHCHRHCDPAPGHLLLGTISVGPQAEPQASSTNDKPSVAAGTYVVPAIS